MPLDFDMEPDERYLEDSDVNMRMDGALCMYKGKPYLAYAHGDKRLKLVDMLVNPLEYAYTVDANDEDVDVSAIDIGYVYDESCRTAMYISRIPIRKQKQGTCTTNTYFQLLHSPTWKNWDNASVSMMTKELFKALNGIYYTYDDLVKMSATAVPVAKHFAVDTTKSFFYQNSKIGELITVDGIQCVKLLPEYNDSVMTYRLSGIGYGVY